MVKKTDMICPFCGVESQMVSYRVDIGSGDFRTVFAIGCRNTDCPVKPMVRESGKAGYSANTIQSDEAAEAKARARWETRA